MAAAQAEEDDDDDEDYEDCNDDFYNFRCRNSKAQMALKKQPKISPTLYPSEKLQKKLVERRQSMPRFRAPIHQKIVHHPKNFMPS